MINGILGKKLGMTQVFNKEGIAIPVTVIEAGPCVVIQRKTSATDGYEAIQLGFEDKREKLANKPELGHFKKFGVKSKRFIREFRVEKASPFEPSQEIKVDIFKVGDYVDITGISKGKGFAGVVKRYGYAGGPGSHGSMFHRRPGSIGASSDPSRVLKGKGLPGHMGGERVTVQKLKVVQVDGERNLLLVKGAVPGARGGYLIVKKSVKAKTKR